MGRRPEKRGMKDSCLQGRQTRPFTHKIETKSGGAPQATASLNILESLEDLVREVKVNTESVPKQTAKRDPLGCRCLHVIFNAL